MKKLPKIYQNNISKIFNNNKRMCYVNKENRGVYIRNILNEIFNGGGYSYDKDVIIKTNNKIYETSIVTRNKSTIVTLDNDVININEIVDIIIK